MLINHYTTGKTDIPGQVDVRQETAVYIHPNILPHSNEWPRRAVGWARGPRGAWAKNGEWILWFFSEESKVG